MQTLPTEISPPNPSALPSAWVDALFARLGAMYGKHWLDLWADVPMADVKNAWREDLAFASGEQIKRALDHCKTNLKFPPTCPDFAILCKQFKATGANHLFIADKTERGPIPANVLAVLAKLRKG